MNKKDLTEEVATKLNITKAEANDALNAILEAIADAVARGEKVTLAGFGTFKAQGKDREGRNPVTGEILVIPTTKVPEFKPSKALKDKVARGRGNR